MKDSLIPVCHEALRGLGKDEGELEAYAVSQTSRSVSIEKNDIHLASSESSGGVGVRAFVDKAVGFTSCNTFDAKEVAEAARGAIAIAKSGVGEEGNVLPEKAALPEVKGLYESSLETLSIGDVLELARRMLAAAHGFDKRVTIDGGAANVVISRRTVANSRGVEAEELSGYVMCYLFGMARDGDDVSTFDMEFDLGRSADNIDVEKVGRKFAEKVIATLGATKGESFKGPVVFAPDALSALLCGPVLFSANAENVQKGQSRWAGKLGTRVASELLNFVDDGLLPGGIATSAFDREGVPHGKLEIIKDGVLQNYYYDTRTAHRGGTKSTGSAVGGTRGVPGIGPTNVLITPGDEAKDDIIAGMDLGVIVNRYSGWPNPISGDFSGVVKGGFLVKNGKVAQPLTGTLIQGNMYEAMENIAAVSKETRQLFNFKLPYVRVNNLSITSAG
jgi:PmbA protein